MNFFAHAVVARWRREDHPFVWGTMLPDLSSMVGVRLASSEEPSVRDGIEFHYATDAAFHGSQHFVSLCAESVDVMTVAGVGRGTSRAVAHVGIELLLDGWLSEQHALLSAYSATLAHAVEQRLVDTLTWEPEQRERMHRGLTRLLDAPVPRGYREPAFVVDRLEYILGRRPRLAIRPEDLPHVSARISQLRDDVDRIAEPLLAQVRERLQNTP